MTGVLCGASPLVKIFNVADTAVDRGVSGEPAPDIISDVLCGYLWMNFRDARGVYQLFLCCARTLPHWRLRLWILGCMRGCSYSASLLHVGVHSDSDSDSDSSSQQALFFQCSNGIGKLRRREWSARAHDTGALVKQHDTGAVGFAQRVRALLRAEAAARSGRRR